MYCHRCLKSAQYHSTINQSDSFTNFQNEKNKITSKVQNVRKGKALKMVPTYFLKKHMYLAHGVVCYHQSMNTEPCCYFSLESPIGHMTQCSHTALARGKCVLPSQPPAAFFIFYARRLLKISLTISIFCFFKAQGV